MKKKVQKNVQKKVDVTEVIVQIQEQLAVLDKKLDTFINKSLTDIAQALAAQKAAVAVRPVVPTPSVPVVVRPPESPRRPMFAIVCYECGKDSELPFKPVAGRAVYCKECFAKRKGSHNTLVSHEVKIEPSPAVDDVNALKPKAVKVKKKALVVKKPALKKKTIAKKKK